jgi:hypothetical protein
MLVVSFMWNHRQELYVIIKGFCLVMVLIMAYFTALHKRTHVSNTKMIDE